MRKLLTALLCLMLAAGPFGVNAYLSARADVQNDFTIGLVTSEIVEEFDPPSAVTPGNIIPKTVRIRNTGLTDSYARVQVLFSDSRMEALCSLDYNTAAWTFSSSDGWWYLDAPLAPGETSPALFTAVTVSSSADPDTIVPFEIQIRQESIQSAGRASFAEARC